MFLYLDLKMFEIWWLNVIIIINTLLCVIYGYYKYRHSYWENLNVPCIPGKIPFGSISSVVLKRQSFIERITEIYSTMKEKGHKYVGIYFITRRALVLIDPELIKKVLVTDFQYFHDRGVYHDEKNDPLSAHLVALSGNRWRQLRQKLTPTFSSGKLKAMFEVVLKCGEELGSALRDATDLTVEIKDLAARYTIDVIGSSAFGIECNSLKNPDAEFRQMGKKVFQSSYVDGFKRLVIRNSPWLAKKLELRVINREVSEFFIGVVSETISYRRREKVVRNDFLQLLMEQMDQDSETDNEPLRTKNFEENSGGLTTVQAAAHAFVFFLAGFETSASTIAFALYELTSQPTVQDRVRAEVFQVLHKHNKAITYDAVMEMHYLERVLLETMRKYPTLVILMRKCAADYTLPDGVKLEKDVPVIIPTYALHHDPEFYPDPDQFNPDRFDDQQSAEARPDHTYLPFGSGPRICIGLRFAMIQMKIALIILLTNFKFTLNDNTPRPLKFNPASFVLSPLDGIWLNLNPLTTDQKKCFT